MTTDLHKRLEEAAEQETLNILRINDNYAASHRIVFIRGTEYGYKEAIKMAEEWLLNNASNYESSITGAVFHQQLAEAFEIDMNKLWEETK